MTFTREVTITDSTAIDRVWYSPSEHRLRIRFPITQSIWEYEKIWPREFGQLVAAHSPGKYFNTRLRNREPRHRVIFNLNGTHGQE